MIFKFIVVVLRASGSTRLVQTINISNVVGFKRFIDLFGCFEMFNWAAGIEPAHKAFKVLFP